MKKKGLETLIYIFMEESATFSNCGIFPIFLSIFNLLTIKVKGTKEILSRKMLKILSEMRLMGL